MKKSIMFLAMSFFLLALSLLFTSCDLLNDVDGGSFSWSEVDGTRWEKDGGAWFEFGVGYQNMVSHGYPTEDGGFRSNFYVNKISGSKIELRNNTSFNVSVSGETLTISNYSEAIHAKAFNGRYTKK